jgi:hypothetical protein
MNERRARWWQEFCRVESLDRGSAGTRKERLGAQDFQETVAYCSWREEDLHAPEAHSIREYRQADAVGRQCEW